MNFDLLRQSADQLIARLPDSGPQCAMILGSGWGAVVDRFDIAETVDYATIPCLGSTGVQGHSGKLHLARGHGMDILVFQGRRHWYEGCGWEPVVFPAYLVSALGVPVMLLTNAAGGIRGDLEPGHLMVVDDHINAMGSNPLAGPHNPILGPRFPDQTAVYDPLLRRLFDESAADLDHPVVHGVYLATSGPTYETPAEITAFRAMGADAVGMSTVPEAMVAHASGLRVCAVSCITNMAAGIGHEHLSHEEVIATTDRTRPAMCDLLDGFLERLQ